MRNSRGFTLLEIIIAISLIAIFITLPVLAYSNYLKKTRDTQRKSSINQIQSALEQYRANNGKYPASDTWKDVLVSQGYLPTIPKDPLDGQAVAGETGVVYKFDYSADADGQNYQLTSRLEENQPGGKGYSNEKSTYVVTPIGPMIRYTTPMVMGSGSSTIASGTLNGAFSGTGTGTVNSGTVTFTGTMSGNTFNGSFTGNAAGSGVSGTISGNFSGTATGNATGSVGGSATLTGGTANSGANTLTGGSFSNLTLTPLSGPGVSRITDGNLTAAFAGSGSGAVTGGSVTYTGTISGNTFTGTASGNVTGSATGTISGPVNLATTGSLEGTVSGTTGILSGNVSNSSFLGTADIANLVLTGNGLPSSAPIPTSTNYPTRAVTPTFTPSPTPVKAIAVMRSIGDHSCLITIQGGLRCWGLNNDRELATSILGNKFVPTQPDLFSGTVTSVSGGLAGTCVLTTAGGVKCWGHNSYGETGNGDNSFSTPALPADVVGLTSGVAAISSGGSHSCALTTGGGVKCWGGNANGQLGNNSITNSNVPVNVTGLTSGVSAIVGGGSQSCALTTLGGVKCWGSNSLGELGNGTTTESHIPVDVTGLTSGVTAISGGSNYACALTSGGVKCWGRITGALNSSTPVSITGATSGISAITGGNVHACALTTGGGVKCWGWNGYGQLGDNTIVSNSSAVSVVGLSSGVSKLGAGGNYACALMNSGGVKCWGWNGYGQLGNGTNTESHIPVGVTGFNF